MADKAHQKAEKKGTMKTMLYIILFIVLFVAACGMMLYGMVSLATSLIQW